MEKSMLYYEKILETSIKKSDINLFDEMFLTNSILKIVPVKKLGNKIFRISDETKNFIGYFFDNKKKENLELL